MAAYKIKELYYTIQGEGAQTGRPAVFCRFSGCNLWSGREEDRQKAICQFCDTDFWGTDGVNGGSYQAAGLASKAISLWPRGVTGQPYVVCTGGEPLLQLDEDLVKAFGGEGFEVGIETNGTLQPPKGLHWICVSPKADTELVIQSGNELKLVFPQSGAEPKKYEHLHFDHFFLQPMDGPEIQKNTQMVIDFCLAHPQWRVSLQTHKMLGIP